MDKGKGGSLKEILAYYNTRAAELSAAYNAVDRRAVHKNLLALLPQDQPLDILDIGAGSGADAAMFATQGHRVVAVEPADNLRNIAIKTFDNKKIEWISDVLPELAEVRALRRQFNAITAVGVLQYLDKESRAKSLNTTFNLLAKGGVLEVFYPTPSSREYQFTIDDNELRDAVQLFNQENAAGARIEIVSQSLTPDKMNRKALNGAPLQFQETLIRRVI